MKLRTCFFPLLAVCAACSAPALRWETEPGVSLTLVRDGDVAWRFAYGSERSKPCFHPLAMPGGRVLTVDRPGDHPWHHGLWLSWKLIDHINYWEHEATGAPAGKTSWRLLDLDTHPDGSARWSMELAYGPRDGETVLRERRVIETTAPAADGSYAIDWDCAFTAVLDCVLDRTPPPGEPDGRPNGGSAGLSLRLVNLADRAATTSEGPVAWNANERGRCVARAFDYSGTLDGAALGVAVLEHHANLNSPTAWYAIRSATMSFVTPAVLVSRPHAMRRGESFALRYRVIVHPGRWDAARLREALAEYDPHSPQ